MFLDGMDHLGRVLRIRAIGNGIHSMVLQVLDDVGYKGFKVAS
jgi:hypothetical protein